MRWLAKLLRMESPEEEAENPSGSQGKLLSWRVVRNKKPMVWATAPKKLEDVVKAADKLIEGAAVFVNLQHIDSAKALRIIDILAGVSYALKGNFYEVGRRLFLFVPPNIPVGGDEETIKAISALIPEVANGTENEFELPVR